MDVVSIADTGMGKTFTSSLLFLPYHMFLILDINDNINFFCVPLSLVTMAAFAYKCFVPGLAEWLKELKLRSFKYYH
jgi:hypothetical protein